MVRLGRLAPNVFAKLELLNPGGSAKDRLAHALLDRALADGRLKPGGKVIEATSGSLGIALTWACAARAFPLTVVMSRAMSLEKRQALKAHRATLVLTDGDAHLPGAIAEARRRSAEEGSCYLGQFEATWTPDVYEASLGAELVETVAEDGGRIDAFVSGFGTGASFTGTARALRRAFPAVRCVAVEPSGHRLLGGGEVGPHRQQGFGPGFVAPALDRAAIDEVLPIDDAAAWRMKLRLGHEEGLLVGITSGANVAAAIALQARLGPEARVYTLLPDTGERYFSLARYFR